MRPYEHRSQPLLPHRLFIKRLIDHALLAGQRDVGRTLRTPQFWRWGVMRHGNEGAS